MGKLVATTAVLDRRTPDRCTASGANAAVVVSQGEYLGTYVVELLSAEGTLLVGRHALSPDDHIQLLFQTGYALALPLKGRVVHTQGEAISIVFDDLTATSQHTFADLLQNTAQDARRQATVLVHPDAVGRQTLKRDLERLDQMVVAFESCEDAQLWLEGTLANVSAALVHPDIEEVSHLLGIVAELFPDARRILIFDRAAARGSLFKLIHSRSTERLLYSPWTQLSLTSALFLSGFPKPLAEAFL